MQNALTRDLRQVIHHRITHVDPYLEGTNLPDLLGLRVTGRYTRDRVARVLPRLTRSDLLELFGLSQLKPADGPLERIVAAAAATICAVSETLDGRSARVTSARRAVIEVIGQRLNGPQIAKLLGVNRSTVSRLRRIPASQTHVQAIRLQLGLWQALPVGRAHRP